jgi:hypothetical protein
MTPIEEALSLWNETAAICGWPLVRGLTGDRERKLRRLIRNGLDEWREALAKAQLSDFLTGKTEKAEKHAGWRMTFDFFITESRFIRILEGNYDNREPVQVSFKSPETVLWEARLRTYAPGKLWLGIWGPKPNEDGCQAPRSLVEEWKQRHEGAH